MNHFLKNIIIFSLVAIPAYALLTWFTAKNFPKNYAYLTNISYRPASNGHLQSRVADISNYHKVNYLVIGSSHAYRGFDPRIFKKYGYTIFNLGSSAQSPIQSRYLLKKYLDQLNPDTVIIETFPGAFTFDGIESSTDVISNDNLSPSLIRLAFLHGNIRTANTLLCRIIDKDILGKRYEEKTYTRHRHDTYIPGGFVAVDQGYYKETTPQEPTTLTYRDDQLNAFKDMLALLKDRHIPYILVQAPVSRDFYHALGDISPFDSIMKASGPYTNYNTILSLPDSDFVDLDHLNQYGVEIFDRKFLNDRGN